MLRGQASGTSVLAQWEWLRILRLRRFCQAYAIFFLLEASGSSSGTFIAIRASKREKWSRASAFSPACNRCQRIWCFRRGKIQFSVKRCSFADIPRVEFTVLSKNSDGSASESHKQKFHQWGEDDSWAADIKQMVCVFRAEARRNVRDSASRAWAKCKSAVNIFQGDVNLRNDPWDQGKGSQSICIADSFLQREHGSVSQPRKHQVYGPKASS
jgi:hypothetical protein